MEELVDAGWKVTENKTEDEIKDIDMKAMFDAADEERRDSQDLVAIPRKVQMNLHIFNLNLTVFFRVAQNSTDKLLQK